MKNPIMYIKCVFLCLIVFLSVKNCRQPQKEFHLESKDLSMESSSLDTDEGIKEICRVDSILYSFFCHESTEQRDYACILLKYKKIYESKHSLSLSEIERVVPRTRKEYVKYYSSYRCESTGKDTSFFVHYIDHTVYKNAFNGDTASICIVLDFARFFEIIDDDEFLQVHWDMTQDVIYDNMFIFERVMYIFRDDNEIKGIYEDFVSS